MLISLFVACFNDVLFPATGQAVVTVLERLGHTVEFRARQTCCGQMHQNTGYTREALPLVRNFVGLFGDAEAVCIPSASCVAMIRDQYPGIAAATEDAAFITAIAQLIPRVYEFSELLVNKLGIEDVGACYPHTVTLHPSCHSLRSLHSVRAQKRLLQNVRELRLIELGAAEECCGFGGTFAVKNPDVSGAMLADKVTQVLATGAEVCTAGDNSCLMHIFGGLHRQSSPGRTLHLAEILAAT